MGDFLYALKMLGVSAVVVFCMQVSIGGKSIEMHFTQWMRGSSVISTLNQVAKGAVMGVKRGAEQASQFVSKTLGKKNQHEVSASRLNIELNRSEAYQREQEANQQTQKQDSSSEYDE